MIRRQKIYIFFYQRRLFKDPHKYRKILPLSIAEHDIKNKHTDVNLQSGCDSVSFENNNNSNKVDLQKWNKLAVIIKLLNMEKEIQTQ